MNLAGSGKLFAVGLLFCTSFAAAQSRTLSTESQKKIDELARHALAETGVPSASIAIVQGGAIAYLQAYGDGRIEPRQPALPSMRYSIGSISKQFTSAAILVLADRGSFHWATRYRDLCPI